MPHPVSSILLMVFKDWGRKVEDKERGKHRERESKRERETEGVREREVGGRDR